MHVGTGMAAATVETGDAQVGMCRTLLDLCPLPLSNAWPAGVGQDGAAHLGEGVQHAIPLNGGSADRCHTSARQPIQPHMPDSWHTAGLT